jgi:hypothetical protein
MALFSHRLLQRRLDSIAHLLTASNADHIVKRLNTPDMSAISAEWEVIVASILNELCEVKFEPALEGNRVADLLIQSGDDVMLADIAAISNAGIRTLNPFDAFMNELRRRAAKRRIVMSGFHIEVGSVFFKKGPRRSVSKYAIPAPSEFDDAFDAQFEGFLQRIKADPDREHSFAFPQPYRVKITRRLEGKHITGSLPGFDAFEANDIPIFSVVKKKRRQIRGASKKYPIGVFLCDAGADAFYQQTNREFSFESIGKRVFEKFRDVGFLVFLLADPPAPEHITLSEATQKMRCRI